MDNMPITHKYLWRRYEKNRKDDIITTCCAEGELTADTTMDALKQSFLEANASHFGYPYNPKWLQHPYLPNTWILRCKKISRPLKFYYTEPHIEVYKDVSEGLPPAA